MLTRSEPPPLGPTARDWAGPVWAASYMLLGRLFGGRELMRLLTLRSPAAPVPSEWLGRAQAAVRRLPADLGDTGRALEAARRGDDW